MINNDDVVVDREAKKAYYKAMTELQANLPIICEKGMIFHNGKLRNTYARYNDIVYAIRPLLGKHGFSISFSTELTDGLMTIEGIVSHIEGYQSKNKVTLPIDSSGFKNDIQSMGSSITYGKRYVICLLFNIPTSNDDDGNGNGNLDVSAPKITNDQICKIRDALSKSTLSEIELCNKGRLDCIEDIDQYRYASVIDFIKSNTAGDLHEQQ